jgi:uncharacterized protein (TIGR02246 family)
MLKAAGASPADSSHPVEAEIRQCLEAWIKAVGAGTPRPITALYAPDAVLLATFDPKPLLTPAEREIYFINFKSRKGLKAVLDECHIQMLGDDAAMANGLYTFRYVDEDGGKTHVKARFTFVYERQPDGEWVIVAHHSSQAPAANGNAPTALA